MAQITISDINTHLQEKLPSGKIVLSPAAFGSAPAISALLEQYFPGTQGAISIAEVALANYHFDIQQQSITFSGTGDGGPFDKMLIESVIIKMAGTEIHISISAATDNWSLYPAFPALQAPIIRQLPFADLRLYWGSYDSDTDTDETTKGFFLEGKLDMSRPPLNLLSAFLPDLNAPAIIGQLDMVGNATGTVTQFVPDGVLSVDTSGDEVQVGPFTFYSPELDIFVNADFNTYDRVWQTDTFLRIKSSVQFKDNRITFQANLYDDANDIIFGAQLDDQPLGAALADLEALISQIGDDITLAIPGFHLQFPNELLLKDIRFGFSPAGNPPVKFITIEVGASPQEKWKLWSDQVYLSNIVILFTVLPPATGNKMIVDGQFSGRVNDLLRLNASFSKQDDYLFYGGLIQPVAIDVLYKFFTGQPINNLPAVQVSRLNFQLNLPQKENQTKYSYAGDLILDGEWEIMKQPTQFSLDGLLFKLNHDPGGNTTIEAGGIMAISDYSLSVDGQYAADQSWQFSGDLDLAGEQKSLADIAQKIDDSFDIKPAHTPSLPDFLTAWEVHHLHTDFNTTNKDLYFQIGVKNADLAPLDLLFGIHLLHDGANFGKKFHGTATYHLGDKKDLGFDLTINEVSKPTPPLKSVMVTGDYQTSTPPTLAELLESIQRDLGIDANLPAELKLNAEADTFAIMVQQVDKKPATIELAGEFSMQLPDSKLNVYFAYTNEVTSDAALQQPILVNGKAAYVFGVSLGGVFDLSELPMVGKIPGLDRLAIDKLGFFYTNAPLTTGQQAYFQVPQVSAPGQLAPDPAHSVVNKPGFNLLAVFGTKGTDNAAPIDPLGTLNIPVGTGKPVPQQPFDSSPAKPASSIHWLDVNKTFGPVSLQQIGLNYSGGEATLGLSASMTMNGFMMALQGLSVTFPMPLPDQPTGGKVSFDLQGLALSLNKGGLQLGGAFLKAVDPGRLPTTSYYGELMIQAGDFGLKAVGGYSPDADPASFFIYLNIEAPLGGPPYLFITGLAGGFGINRSLILPTVDQLPNCLLIPGNPKTPAQEASPADTVKKVLPALQSMFHNEAGQYWVAVGIQFTSFEMIHAFALVTVAFGVDLQVGLIGTCSMSFPPDENAVVIAYVEIDLVASFTARTGLLAVDGRLSPASFIFGGFVHLSGGFAFYIWFSGPHKGDFVVSLGGYHPAFVKPDYYPAVPRLGMSFGLGPFQVTGQAYFALTPGMMMAGIRMSATWKAGRLKAWFDVGVDFLIVWAPFHYQAEAYIYLGISLDVGLFTVKVHAGADIYLWGPEFGGTAHIDLDIVSFTIDFGASRRSPAPVGWKVFKNKFLPPDTTVPQHALRGTARMAAVAPLKVVNLVKADVSQGLLQKDVPGYDWVVDPNYFAILTNSTIPANNVVWNGDQPARNMLPVGNIPNALSNYRPVNPAGQPLLNYPEPLPTFSATQIWDPALHIRPMKLEAIQSYHSITLYQQADNDAKGVFSHKVNTVALQPVLLSTNQALWGHPGANTSPNAKRLADCVLTGFLITPIPRHPDQVSQVLLFDLLFQSGYEAPFAYTTQALDTRYQVSSTPNNQDQLEISVTTGESTQRFSNQDYLLSTLVEKWVITQRNTILTDLNDNGFTTYMPTQIELKRMATEKALTHWPVVELMGT